MKHPTGKKLRSRITGGQEVHESKKLASKKLRREQTKAEQFFWQKTRNRKLAGLKFRRQQVIHGFIVDFFCPEINLVVELDGQVHNQLQQADGQRQQILESLGLTVARFTNEQVIGDWLTVQQQLLAYIPFD